MRPSRCRSSCSRPIRRRLVQWAPRVADAIGKVRGVVDVLNGIDNTISNPAVVFQVNPAVAARAGFTPEEVAVDASAILEGEPAATPVIANDIAYTIRVRYPDANRSSLDAMSNTLLNSSSGHTATLGSLATVTELPGQNEIRRENLQRDVTVTARLEGTDLGSAIKAVQKAVDGPASAAIDPRRLRRYLRRAAAVVPRSPAGAGAGDSLGVRGAAVRIPYPGRAAVDSGFGAAFTSGVFLALLITRIDFNIASFMGLIMVIGIVAKNGILLLDADQKFRLAGLAATRRDDPGRTAPAASHPDDRARRRCRNAATGAGTRRRFADAPTSGHRGHRRHNRLDGVVVDHHSGRSLLPQPRLVVCTLSRFCTGIVIAGSST